MSISPIAPCRRSSCEPAPQLAITPCLLGGLFKLTGNRAPMVAFADVKGKWDYERLEIRRFIARHHLDKFRMNPHFPVNSLN